MCINPPMARTRNQSAVMGPKNFAIRSVPCACIQKRPVMTRIEMIGMTFLPSPGATSFKPSTADKTEMAGVITASP